MQKKYLKRTILLLLLTGVIGACVYEEGSSLFNDEALIADAQKWYETNRGETGMELRSDKKGPRTRIKPYWEKSYTKKDKNYETVESYVLSDEMFNTMTEESAAKYESTNDPRYMLSMTKLVIRKNRKTGVMDGFLMTIVPDLEYTESTDFKPFRKMHYLDRDKKFNGDILYHDMDGVFVNAWHYVDGIAYVMTPKENGGQNFELRGNDGCYTYILIVYYTTCADNGYNGTTQGSIESGYTLPDVVIGGCSTSYYVLGHYVYCTGGANGGYSGDGSYGGGSGGGTSTEIQTMTDCPPSAVTNSTTINNVLNSEDTNLGNVKSLIGELKEYAFSQSNEYGLAVQYGSGQYYVLNQGDISDPNYFNSGTTNSVAIGVTANTYLIAHTHPSGTYAAPSPLDAITLANSYFDGSSNITANVIFAASGVEYMVYIDNSTQLTMFYNGNNSGFFQANGSLFKSNSVWASDYNDTLANMIDKGYSQDDARAYTLSYVLDKYNTGLKVYEKKNGSFKELRTDVVGNNYLLKICP